ncbi:NUDIX hydrolase [Nocardiopsis metallicus]|uniref:8-oxo-dGTP pyrophosphatase MutT (NUDIX family) n=1 Tax=Nocardiopsis metallicus TaxID=179819 RepID=A0A840WSF0_9ACTN|nr:NUDIX domain-containing protein [Nocardiopsis metallicus]MBB5494865.1 8-oxo-dGTP pyrophosphatase MutT (NUDIX family) [Nocardiopsis metallicus]
MGFDYLWHGDQHSPTDLPITQVYGYVFDAQGRVVILQDAGMWNAPGGTPEPEIDQDPVATLVREVWEEVQVRFEDTVYLGYQSVGEDGGPPQRAQLRMAARLVEVGERAPDPDNGRVHVRHRCSLPEAERLLGWGAPAREQFKSAAKVAVHRWRIPVHVPAPAVTD